MPTARAICASRAIDSSTSLPATIIRSASSSTTTTMNGKRPRRLGALRHFLVLDHLPHVAVVLLDVADAERRERLVALLHLAHGPAQRVGGLLRIDDDRRHQVRDVLVHPELEALRIDHDQPHVVRRRAIEDAREHRVQPDRFAGAGRSGDQQVRHRREIRHERLAVNRLAERERQLRGRALIGVRLEQLAQRDRFAMRVRDLDADGGLARNALDEHRLGLHGEAEVVGKPGDLAVLHAGVGLELEGRDHRAGVDLHDRAFDRELAALLFEQARRFHQLALVDLALGLRRIEQRRGRQRVAAQAALGEAAAERLGIGQRQRWRDRRLRALLDDRRRRPLLGGRSGDRRLVVVRRRRRRARRRCVSGARRGAAPDVAARSVAALSASGDAVPFLTCLAITSRRSRARRRSSSQRARRSSAERIAAADRHAEAAG